MEGKTELVIGAFLIYNDRLLLVHHRKLDKWLPPGGHIEANETPDEAVAREVKEETGLNVKFLNKDESAETKGEITQLALPFYANVHRARDHDHACLFYLCEPRHGKVKISHESKDHKWVTAEELKTSKDIPEDVKKIGRIAFERHKIRKQT